MKKLIPLAFLLVGCADLKPFARMSVGPQINEYTDELLHNDQPDQCSKNLKFRLEGGAEHKNGSFISLAHQSWVFCGGNHSPELYDMTLWFGGQWGGWND